MFMYSNDVKAIIHDSLQLSLNNKISFLEHVQTIAQVRILSYEVNLTEQQVTYTFENGSIHTEQLPELNIQENLEFHKETVQKAVKDIQQQFIDYPTFLSRIGSAGTQRYQVDISKGEVNYVGNKDSHKENFPKILKK